MPTIALPHLLRPAPMRKRLWQLLTLLAIVTFGMVIGNALAPADKALTSRALGTDFLAFYTAGTFVREGRVDDLYDLQKVAAFQKQIATTSGLEIEIDYNAPRFGPWWNPPFYAWVFAPLSLMSFSQAVATWTLINVAALGGAIALLMRMLAPKGADHDAMGRPLDWRTTGLVPFALILSMPFIQAIGHGQNTFVSLFLLCCVVTCWRCKRAVLAGAFCALLGYKPQLAAVVAMVLVCSLGLRALVGLCFVGSALVLVTQLTLPGSLVDYLRLLPANVHFMQVEHVYLWDRHATLKAFWRMLVQGKAPGEMGWAAMALFALSFLLLAAILARAVWSHVARHAVDHPWSRVTEQQWRDRLIGATVCCAPLLMPFYFDYDLLLLAIPATLLAAEELARPVDQARSAAQRWLPRMWLMLYAWMMINPGMTGMTRVNGNVALLSLIGLMMTLRATRVAEPSASDAGQPTLPSVTMAPQRKAA
jgi:hypothetical protein